MRERNDRTVAVQDFVLDSSILVSFGPISELFEIVTNSFPGIKLILAFFSVAIRQTKHIRKWEST